MPNSLISKLTIPVDVSGTITNVTYDIKDAYARQAIHDLGDALYWVGVTTTELTDGATTNPITVGGESVTVRLGGMASYDGLEFVWNDSAWQAMGHANFGDLAFADTAEGSYTPAGTIAITKGTDTTGTVNSITDVGALPTWAYDSLTETASFAAGALPTKGSDVTVVTQRADDTAAFTGTQATITVAPASSNP